MATRTMELTEGEQFVVWMLRALEKPGAPAFVISATNERVTLMLPGSAVGRPDDVAGVGRTLSEAHEYLKAAQRLSPPLKM